MRKRDGGTLDHETLEEFRIRAVERVEAGESPEDVVRKLGFGRTVICNWLPKYSESGLDALRADEQHPKLVEVRREEESPRIRALAKRERATMFFADGLKRPVFLIMPAPPGSSFSDPKVRYALA